SLSRITCSGPSTPAHSRNAVSNAMVVCVIPGLPIQSLSVVPPDGEVKVNRTSCLPYLICRLDFRSNFHDSSPPGVRIFTGVVSGFSPAFAQPQPKLGGICRDIHCTLGNKRDQGGDYIRKPASVICVESRKAGLGRA